MASPLPISNLVLASNVSYSKICVIVSGRKHFRPWHTEKVRTLSELNNHSRKFRYDSLVSPIILKCGRSMSFLLELPHSRLCVCVLLL